MKSWIDNESGNVRKNGENLKEKSWMIILQLLQKSRTRWRIQKSSMIQSARPSNGRHWISLVYLKLGTDRQYEKQDNCHPWSTRPDPQSRQSRDHCFVLLYLKSGDVTVSWPSGSTSSRIEKDIFYSNWQLTTDFWSLSLKSWSYSNVECWELKSRKQLECQAFSEHLTGLWEWMEETISQ